MSNHYWEDIDFDWGEFHKAQSFIIKYVYRHSLCFLMCKEKYGTIRYEYVFAPFTSFYYKSTLHKLWCQSFIVRLWTNYGWKTTVKAVYKAIEKWPQFEDELLEDLASNEKLVGKEVHDKYWKTIE